MSLARRVGHNLIRASVQPSRSAFVKTGSKLESVQREQLKALLTGIEGTAFADQHGLTSRCSWEDFASRAPLTTYEDWRLPIERQKLEPKCGLINSPVMRYQPTSGSTSAVKWIPYTSRFLQELDGAISPWLGDLYQRFPGIRQGAHYWSLSWVPTEMRAKTRGHINDDMKLLSLGKRLLVGSTQAVPDQVSLAPTSDDSLFASLVYLASRADLTALSIWSPTFGLGLLEKLSLWRQELAAVLAQGHWGSRKDSLGFLPCPVARKRGAQLLEWAGDLSPEFFRSFWPKLALVSAWDTAASAPWAQRLQELLPHAGFQGKGLWATEGVVTIPQGNDFVLAARSHFYEFEEVSSQRVIPSWKLEPGQEVIPVMSTGSGLMRYRMNDVMKVEGFRQGMPSLRFMGRNDGVDLAGEKISTVLAQKLLDDLDWPQGVKPVALLGADEGCKSGRPAYVLLAEANPNLPRPLRTVYAERLAVQLEQALSSHFHYLVARNLNQLGPVRCICHAEARKHYLEQCRERGMIEGNIKIEALRHWTGPLPMDQRTTRTRRVKRAIS